MKRWLVPGLAASICASCSFGDARRGSAVERDSAGVRIVESRRPRWNAGRGWTVRETPDVQIGSAAGAENEQLYRVQDVERLSNAAIVVVNGGSHELLLYSAEGHHIRTVGRHGEGPGELEGPRKVWILPDDSLAVVAFSRLSVFDSTGAFARSYPIAGWSPHDRFADGTYLWLVIPRGVDQFQPGYFHPDFALVRAGADGSEPDTIAHLPGDEMFRSASGNGVSSWHAPFGTVRMAAAAGDFVYTGDGSTFEVRRLTATGAVNLIIRTADGLSVTRAAVDSFEAALLDGLPVELQRRRRALFTQWSYPTTRPAYDQLLVDRAGNIWARHYRIGQGHPEWSVFDEDGHWLGVVHLPGRLAVMAIGNDYVLGVATDADGVEYVQLFRLKKLAGTDQESLRSRDGTGSRE